MIENACHASEAGNPAPEGQPKIPLHRGSLSKAQLGSRLPRRLVFDNAPMAANPAAASTASAANASTKEAGAPLQLGLSNCHHLNTSRQPVDRI